MSARYQPGVRRDGLPPLDALIIALGGPQIVLSDSASELPTYVDVASVLPADDALHYLGTLDGRAVYAVALSRSVALPEGWLWVEMRMMIAVLESGLFGVIGRAAQILEWARNHRFCGRCGAPTAPDERPERLLTCTACGFGAYPRINPCVIGIVTRGDEILLARAHRFVNGMFSALAGFMEVGESAEHTFAREVREEVGVEISNIRYFSSQPWPFPSNLMLGFIADYAGGELVLQDDEIAEAGFYHYTDLPPVPPKGSIARALIDHFVAERTAHHA